MTTRPEQLRSTPDTQDFPTARPYLSVTEAAAVLGLSRNTVYANLHAGRIPHLRLNKKFLIPRAVLLNLATTPRDQSDAEASPR